MTVVWVLFLTISGVLVLKSANLPVGGSTVDRIFYSLDRLVPIVTLSESHSGEEGLTDLQRYYFYIHRLIGFVLASYLVAGLSGLTG